MLLSVFKRGTDSCRTARLYENSPAYHRDVVSRLNSCNLPGREVEVEMRDTRALPRFRSHYLDRGVRVRLPSILAKHTALVTSSLITT